MLDTQLFARQIDALICLTDDSSLHFVSKKVLNTMATTLKELGTNGSILTDSLFNNKSMMFNLNTHCDHMESILVQIPLMAYSTQITCPSGDLGFLSVLLPALGDLWLTVDSNICRRRYWHILGCH